MSILETWRAAREDTCNGELTYREWGDYKKVHVTHGWWVLPNQWELSIGYLDDWQPGGSALHGTRSLSIQIGPFAWSLNVCQPLKY